MWSKSLSSFHCYLCTPSFKCGDLTPGHLFQHLTEDTNNDWVADSHFDLEFYVTPLFLDDAAWNFRMTACAPKNVFSHIFMPFVIIY